MKKLIIFLFVAVIALTAKSQTVTFPANGMPLYGGVSMIDWIQVDTFPIAQMDSIRYIRINGINYINKNYKSTTWDAVSLRLFADNTDQTARLVHLLTNRTFIKHYIIRQQFTGNLRIDGSVTIPADVTLEIDGVIITGNGSITGATSGSMVLAQPDVQVFATTLSPTKIKTSYGYFPSKWFGTVNDGATDNYTMFLKAQAATYSKFQPVFVPWGDHRINSVFTQTVGFVGEPGSKIKYNRASSATTLIMWTMNADSLLLRGIHIDGSNKVQEGIRIASGKIDVEINNVEIDSIYQVGADNSTVEGIYFTNSNDRLAIRWCNIHDIDAPNTGIARGIRGAGSTGGLDMVFEYNTFDKIVSTYVSNTDADQLCLQDYTNTLNAIIRFNKFKNIGKRGAKMTGNGISFYRNEGFSTLYLSSKRSFSFFSVYGSNISATYNKCTGGVYENGIDIGAPGSYNYNTVSHNELYFTETSLGTNDGIRMFGTENWHNEISFNTITHARKGIWLDCSSRYTVMIGNQIDSTTDNAYSTQCTSNSYPNVWHFGLKMIGNGAKESTSSIAYYLYRVNGGVVIGNTCDSISALMYGAALDSCLGVDIHGNTNNTGGSSPNRGVLANRPALTNAAACENLEFYATDRDSAYRWSGANGWVNISGINYKAVTNTKLADMAAKTYKGRTTNSTGVPEDVSIANMRADLGLADGIYTPTISDKVNVGTTIVDSVGYSRNGNSVTVWGSMVCNVSNAGTADCSFQMTLPITSNFPGNSTYNKYGIGWCMEIVASGTYNGSVIAVGGTQKVMVVWNSGTGVSVGVNRFHFSYTIY